MKRFIAIVIVASIIIVIIYNAVIIKRQKEIMQIKAYNYEYEQYNGGEMYGTDVITIINKAIDQNKKEGISKNEKGQFIDDGEKSIIAEIVLITDEDLKQKKSYRMESIDKLGIISFKNNFNTAKFKLNEIDYHTKSGRVSKIVLEQQYE